MTRKTNPVRSPARRGPLPLSAGLVLAALLAGSLIAAFAGPEGYLLSLGGYLDIEGIVLLGIAWIGYLRRDGLRIASPRRAAPAKPADSWGDRVPALGDPPLPPHARPGEEGPDGEAYRRLAVAEEGLRSRILGAGGEGEKGGDRIAKPGPSPLSFAGAGLLVLALGLCFEYVLPRLLS